MEKDPLIPMSGHLMQEVTKAYWASAHGVAMTRNPMVSLKAALDSVLDDHDIMVYHYHRFVSGAADNMAVAGWSYVMDNRQRVLDPPLNPSGLKQPR